MSTDVNAIVKQVDTYLTVLRLSGNYKERQRIGLTNQALPVFCDEARREVLAAVARGALATDFLREREEKWPTHGTPLPEAFEQYVAQALEAK